MAGWPPLGQVERCPGPRLRALPDTLPLARIRPEEALSLLKPEPRWHGALVGALALGLYVALFGGDLGSLAARFLGQEAVDAYGTHWFYWFVERSLAEHTSMSHTDLYFFPFGKDIYAHTGANVLDAIIALPFRLALGAVRGYNAFVLAALLANGLAAWRLMGQFTSSRVARIVGAALYALNPFLLAELRVGRPTQVFQPFLPLFFYHLLRFEEEGWRHALLGGLHLALTAFIYWFYAIFAGMIAVVHFLQRAILHPARRQFLLRHVAAAAISLAFVAPAALPLIFSTVEGDTPGLLAEPEWPYLNMEMVTGEGVKIGQYQFQPLLRANGYLIHDDGADVFFPDATVLTFTQVVLVALGLALSRHRWVLGSMLGAALLIAVGHVVWLGGPALPNPLYVLMVKVIPFMRRLWWPGRALVLVSLLGGVLAAAGLHEVRQRWPRLVLPLGLLSLLSFGYELRALGYQPFPTWDATIPAGYACLAQGPPGAIIELPYARSQAHLYYQTRHGRPIFGGMVEDNPVFTPEAQRALARDNSFLALLLKLSKDPSVKGEFTPEDSEAVHALGYRYVVVQHAGLMIGSSARRLVDPALSGRSASLLRRLTALLDRPVYTDPDITIFAPWGGGSPCGDEGPGRLAWPMHEPADEISTGEPVVVRSK